MEFIYIEAAAGNRVVNLSHIESIQDLPVDQKIRIKMVSGESVESDISMKEFKIAMNAYGEKICSILK